MTQDAQNPKTPANALGPVENKSLEHQATEVKAADGVKVTMLHHHRTDDGQDLIPGETYELPHRKAHGLVSVNRAKFA